MDNLEGIFRWKALTRHSPIRSVAVAITLVSLSIYAALHLPRNPGTGTAGTLTVTANMAAFSPSIVQVGLPATANLSATLTNFNPSIPSPDEGTLIIGYNWTASVVQYKALASGQYGDPPSGSYSADISPTQPSGNSSATLTFSAYVAGYWEVAVSCSATVLDLEGDISWGGSADAGPQYITSAMVTFSPDQVVTGADKNKPGAIFAPVTATIAPADLINKVSVNTFVPSGTGSAGVESSKPNASAGTIAFDLYGINGTSKTMPKGDIELDAKDGSTVLGTVEVTVVIPAAIGTPHPQVNPGVAVAPVNIDLGPTSVPSDSSVPAGEVLLGTMVETTQSIPVVDQFGISLNSVYNGHAVYEGFNGSFVDINVTVNSGIYPDHVGYEADGGNLSLVRAGSPRALAWPTSASHYSVPSPQTKNGDVKVQIAGFTLNPSVVNRSISYNNPDLTVKWP